jgi:hypothetical protein
MIELLKPIPDHRFHGDPDDLLTSLIKIWRRDMASGKADEAICKQLIDDAYKVLGYRCALEYMEKYGD